MCSYIFTIVYIICVVGAGILNIVAIATPNWALEKNVTLTSIFEESWTIFGKCITEPGQSECASSWKNGNDYEKATFVCMAASICFCALSLVWAILSIIACCCTQCLRPPMVLFAGLACASVTAALISYGIAMPAKSSIGYSMWCAIAAAVVLLIDTVLSFAIVHFGKKRHHSGSGGSGGRWATGSSGSA